MIRKTIADVLCYTIIAIIVIVLGATMILTLCVGLDLLTNINNLSAINHQCLWWCSMGWCFTLAYVLSLRKLKKKLKKILKKAMI